MVPSEAVFEAVRTRLRDRAVLQHNIWMMLGRGVPRSINQLAEVLWHPEPPPGNPRIRQFRVGAFCSHLNKHLAKYDVVVKPGELRETYQTYKLSEWQAQRAAAQAALLADRQARGLPPPKPVKAWGLADPATRAKWVAKAVATRARKRAEREAAKKQPTA